MSKTKTKCVKDFPCERCGKKSMLQILSPNSMRCRHYIGVDPNTKKPRFEYHRQTSEYVNRILESKSRNPDLKNDQTKTDQLFNNGSISENTSGRSLAWLGHQPPTLTTRVQIPATAP